MHVVGIDCRFGSKHAGLGTVTRSLVTELVKRRDGCAYVLFVRSLEEPWLSSFSSLPGVTVKEAPFEHYSLAEQTDFPNVLQDSECSLLLSPHFNVPIFCPIPFVCMVHDLILHTFPGNTPWYKRLAYKVVLRSAIKRAKKILTVSEFTKKDIGLHYGASAEAKTVVTYPAASSAFHPRFVGEQDAAKAAHRLDRPFFLYVGNCKPHKNVAMLLDAFERAALPGIDLALVVTGRECSVLRRREGVRFLQDIDPDELAALYSAALGCVTATLAEGFCIPLIEAMACGCPVLATNVGPLPEVCGEHALLVEPSVDALAQGMRTVATDASLRSSARRRELQDHAATFSWAKSAASVAHTLHDILASLPSP